MKSLQDIFDRIGHYGKDIGRNDKGSTHTYLHTYEHLFHKQRRNTTILEMGVAHGDSLVLWDEYFEHSTIYGIDIDTKQFKFTDRKWKNHVKIFEHDCTKGVPAQLENYIFNIIIDDAGHDISDQFQSFLWYKKNMAAGGLYIIEDVSQIDKHKSLFQALHKDCTIIDLRANQGRYDDVLVIYKF